MTTIESHLELSSIRFPEKIAFVDDHASITYAELFRAACERADRLLAEGFFPGKIVMLEATPTIDYFINYFAVHLAHGVVVPLAKDLPANERAAISEQIEGSIVPEGTADILFTTGTTGKSKGVVISHETILADAENLVCAHGYSHDLTFIISGPLNHCGCWSKVFPCVMTGATMVLKNGIKDLNDFFEALTAAKGKIATFQVPSSLKIIMEFGADRLATFANRFEFIETGGAPMAHKDMLALCALLQKTRLFNTYASTETGIISTYNFNDGRCIFGCVGKSMKHSSIAINEAGRIVCSGATLMTGYLNDDDLTRSILKDGQLVTADNGRIDDDGNLHILGRSDDILIVGGYNVSPLDIEEVAMGFEKIKDCICIAAPHIVLGTALKLLYIPKDGETFTKKDIAFFLKSKLEPHQLPLAYEVVDTINMTFNGKKDRKSYNP